MKNENKVLQRKSAGSYFSNKRKPQKSSREIRTFQVDLIKEDDNNISDWYGVIVTVIALIGAVIITNLN